MSTTRTVAEDLLEALRALEKAQTIMMLLVNENREHAPVIPDQRRRASMNDMLKRHIAEFGAILVKYPNLKKGETRFTKEVRDRLVWSWNYGTAETMVDDTVRHNAQWISSGIKRGEDATDEELVLQFLQDGRLNDPDWIVDDAVSRQIVELVKQPWVVALVEKEERNA